MNHLSNEFEVTADEVRSFLVEIFNILGYVPYEETMFKDAIEYITYLKKIFIKKFHPDVSDRTTANRFGNYLEIFDKILSEKSIITDAYISGKLRGADEYKKYYISLDDIESNSIELEGETLLLPKKPKVVFKGFGEPGLPPGDIIYEFPNLIIQKGTPIYIFNEYDVATRTIDGYKLSQIPIIYSVRKNGALMEYKGNHIMVQKIKIPKR